VRGVSADVPFAALEHVALGLELLEPGMRLRAPAGLAYELSVAEGPPVPPADASPADRGAGRPRCSA
jgi:hypothetical protein